MFNAVSEKSYDLTSVRALVVDDSELMRELIQEVLRSFGIGYVHSAPSAEDAMTILERDYFDVIVVDWQMEGMDGLRFIQNLRVNLPEPARRTPIIMCTGHSDRHHVLSARDAGVNQFLTKPVTAGELFDKLVEAVWDERPFIISDDYVGPQWPKAQKTAPSPALSNDEAIDLDML